VFKVVTAATALETGSSTLESSFFCSGSVQVGPHTMRCANSNGHGSESFVQATINSCNPAFIAIGQAIGSHDFSKYFQAFGLTEKTGIDLPGEATSIYIREEDMGIVELSSAAFGQSNKITPIQMITAVSAVVNGGYLVQPHIISQITDYEGNIVKSYDTEIKRQVISGETSQLMAEIMEQVVLNANGRNAYVAGFRIGGKSGTAQDLTSDEEGKYWASFVGIAPADDPEIAVLIVLDNARSEKSIYGGILVAPIVGSIMKNVLPYIGVDAVYTEEELETIDVAAPDVTGRTLTSAYAYLQPLGLSYTVIGSGTEVVAQYPLAGQSLPRGSTVILYTEETEQRSVEVPDLSGRTPESAESALQSLGLNIRVSGSASSTAEAVSQSLEAGASVPAGSVVDVEFIDNAVND
ncbi:MAG: penicillin-binding transpeptidase domain-containing protein, partial [Oscillospiraceae bacterium]|nr:penicillin-binding transpeptidase domain-containing protein [Oscillospiraceae bacterium]